MGDNPFANFVPSAEIPAASEPPKNETKKKRDRKKADRKKKPAAAPTKPAIPAVGEVAAAVPRPKKERKKRAKKAGKAPRSLKIDMASAFVAIAGLNESDCALLDAAAKPLSSAPKKARQRVIVALGKIFA